MENFNWEAEAQAVINDIGNCVASAGLSTINSIANYNNRIAYINIKTKEGERITVKLDCEGFSVVGKEFNNNSLESSINQKYETIYALLHYLSPSYTVTFAQSLTERLSQLSNGRNGEN